MCITHCYSNYVGIKWLQLAREKLKVGDKAAKFLPGGLQEVDKNVQDAKKIHDHYLEKVRFLIKISFKSSFELKYNFPNTVKKLILEISSYYHKRMAFTAFWTKAPPWRKKKYSKRNSQ